MLQEKRKTHNFMALFFFFLLFLPCLVSAQDKERRVPLRVGYVEEKSYFYKDAYGEYDGYISEILHSIAMFGNFDLEIVEFPNYAEENKALDAGWIDVETAVPRTENGEKRYAFSNLPTATVVLSLLVNENDARYEYGNAASVNNMRVATVTDDAAATYFLEWCRKNALYPKVQYYPTIGKALSAIKDGNADGIIWDNTVMPGCQPLLHFANMPCYAMFNKNKMEIKRSFDDALEQLLYAQPMYEQQLYYEHVISGVHIKSVLSDVEREYLKTHKKFIVAMTEQSPPYFHKDLGEKPTGILPAFYDALGKKLGIDFVYKIYPNTTAAEDAVAGGQADILGIYSGSPRFASGRKLRLIGLTENQPMVKITKFGKENGKVAAILTGDKSVLKDKLVIDYGFHVIEFPTAKECFAAVQQGAADCMVCDNIMANWLFNNNRTDDYSLTTLAAQRRLYMAVSPDNLDIYRILAHEYRVMNPKFASFIASNIFVKESLMTFIEKMPIWGVVVFAGIMTVLVVLLIVLLVSLRRHYQEKVLLADKKAENDKEKIKLENLKKNADEKNLFFSNISHDMRTPLNAIISYTYLARKQAAEPETKDYLEKISMSGKLLLELINDTLLISKIASGKLEIQAEPVTTAEINKVLAADISSAAAERGVIFTMDDSRLRPRTVMADKVKIEKIVLNLLSNAVKFTAAGKHVWYIVEDDPAGGPSPDILCTIRDEGIGMSKEYQQKLYTPFVQEGRPGYESQGTGLGLSIVKQLTDLLGGTITMDSEKDKGTTFRLRFHMQEVAPQKEIEQENWTEEDLACLKGKKVLLCEDNKINIDIATRLMQAKGMLVDAAKDGRDGVDKFKASAPGFYAAILMDLRMPVLNGYEATKELRELAREDAKTIPIIAMTADAFEEDVNRCLEAGMSDHVAKPIEPRKLYMALISAVKGR